MDINQYRISELADKAGVTKRTIHYYMGRGLLPPPNGAGLGTTYSDEHLYRIMLIKKLQDAYLPLDEIKKRMAGMSLEDVRGCFEGEVTQRNMHEQTCEYRVNGNVDGNTIGIHGKNVGGNAGGNAGKNAGISYERLDVGFGLEIHFPAGNDKARELAEMLYKYAEKMLKEG